MFTETGTKPKPMYPVNFVSGSKSRGTNFCQYAHISQSFEEIVNLEDTNKKKKEKDEQPLRLRHACNWRRREKSFGVLQKAATAAPGGFKFSGFGASASTKSDIDDDSSARVISRMRQRRQPRRPSRREAFDAAVGSAPCTASDSNQQLVRAAPNLVQNDEPFFFKGEKKGKSRTLLLMKMEKSHSPCSALGQSPPVHRFLK